MAGNFLKKSAMLAAVGMVMLLTAGTAAAGYSDSMSDTTTDVWHWHQVGGNPYSWGYNAERPNIDITQISMSESGGIVTITLAVKGTITDSEKMVYWWGVVDDKGTATTDDDGTYTIYYTDSTCTFVGGGEYGFLDLSVDTTHSGGTLTTHFSLSDAGNPSQLKFDDDMGCWAYEYTVYGDTNNEYYWDMVPNEATGDNGDGNAGGNGSTPGFEFIAVTAAVCAVALLAKKRH